MDASTSVTRIAAGASSNLRLRTRLVIILMVISGLGLTGMSVAVWTLTRGQIYERVDADLRSGLDSWALSRGQNVATNTNLPSEYMLISYSPGQPTRSINALSHIPDLSRVKRDRIPHTLPAKPLPAEAEDTSDAPTPLFRVLAVEAPDGTITLVAKNLSSEVRLLDGLALVLASISMLVLVLMGATGTYFVRRALQPLRELEDTALAIADGDIDCRAPAWPRGTEYGRLSYAMNTMVSQLQETLEESQQKEEQMRRFVGDASHELRTPLTSVRGYTELYRAGATDDADMVLSKIDEESARMKLLVEDLLALTRSEGSPLNVREVDMLELALAARSSANAAFPERTLTVDNQVDDVPLVSGDPDRLHQVLMNLINNAFKHAGPDAAVTITLREYLDRVYVDVADNGTGMSKEVAEHIFERFYRADSSRNRSKSGGGSGLGLAITKSIVEQHGGAISVESAPGKGARFTFSVPKFQAGAGATN